MKNSTQLPPALMPRERKDTGLIVAIVVCVTVVFGAVLFAASFAAETDGIGFRTDSRSNEGGER